MIVICKFYDSTFKVLKKIMEKKVTSVLIHESKSLTNLMKNLIKSVFIAILWKLTYIMNLFFLGPNTYNENETIAKYEIMDGAPVRGEFNWFTFYIYSLV